MVKGFSKGSKVRLFTGGLVEVEHAKAGDLLMGDDGNPRKIEGTSCAIGRLFVVTYSSYLDVVDDKTFVCSEDTLLVLIPDGNRELNRMITTNADNRYLVEFVEPIVDAGNKISRVELARKVFDHAEDALSFVDKALPNFLYEVRLADFLKYPEKVRRLFKLVRSLLPIRYTEAVTTIQNATKEDVETVKEFGVRSIDLPWLCGLYLATGTNEATPYSFKFFLKNLQASIFMEVRRIFECLKNSYTMDCDEASGQLSIRFVGDEGRDFFQNFMAQFHMVDAGAKRYTKDKLNPNIHLESFSRIRGPFLAGIIDGSSDYGLSDINHGLECYIRGVSSPGTREVICDLARSCSLAAIINQDMSLTLAGGMLFRIPCIANIPKDFPGLVSLTSYPNSDNTSVLLGMPQPFSIKEAGEGSCYALSITGPNTRCFLDDYTVVHV